jgi:hypothetical protein
LASRYWVGGTGTWDNLALLKWSTTSGGLGGSAVPTSADDVFFDANSGANTVTIGAGTAICDSLTMTGFTGTLAFGTNSIDLTGSGSNTFLGATTYSVTGTPLINITGTGTLTIAAGAVTEANSISFTINNAASNAIGITGSIRNLTFAGTYTGNLTNQTRTIYGNLTLKTGMTVNGGGNGTTFASTSGTQQITSAGLNLDFPITSGVAIATTAATGNGTTATLTFASQTSVPFIVGSTINVVNVVPAGYNGTYTVTACTATTVSYANATTGAQTTAGGVGTTNTVQLIDALTLGSTRTLIHVSGTFDLTNKTVTTGLFSQGISAVTRTMAFGTTGSINVTGNNASIWVTNGTTPSTLTGTPTVNFTYSGSTGTRTTATGSNHSTTNRYNFNFTAGSDTVNVQNQIQNLDFTGFSGTWANFTLSITGNLTLSSGMTVGGGTNTVNFFNWGGTHQVTSVGKSLNFPITIGTALITTAASGNGTTATLTFASTVGPPPVGSTISVSGITPAGYNTSSAVVTASTSTSVSYANTTTGAQTVAGVVATTSTVRLVDALIMGSTRALGLTAGTLDTDAKNLTCGNFTYNNSNTKTLTFTNSTVTIAGGSSTIGFVGSLTGTTFNLTGNVIVFTTSGTALVNNGGNGTLPAVTMGGTGQLILGSGTGTAPTITTLSNTVSPCTISLNSTISRVNVTNFNLSGTAGNLVTFNTTTAGTARTIRKTSGTVNAYYLNIQDSIADGGAVWNAYDSTNSGNNTGWSFLTANSGNFLLMFG